MLRSLDLDRMETSDSVQVETSFLAAYIPEQDVFSAVWLSNHRDLSSFIYADFVSSPHVLTSYGLIPAQ